MEQTPEKALVRSLASDSLADLTSKVADVALHAALGSGVLDGIPVVGLLNGLLKTAHNIRETLFVRKLALFLQQLATTPLEARQLFVEQLGGEQEQRRFGEALLLLIDRAEDMQKPVIVGRIIAALACGKIEQEKALRISSMVDRCYSSDLAHLTQFVDGAQSNETTPIAQSLFSAGFLSNCGFDGGDASGGNSGVIYAKNEYGDLLVRYGLP